MARLDYSKISPEGYKAMLGLNKYISTLPDKGLMDMVYLRVSQINGCSYCVDMHWSDAIKNGVEPRKINSVVTWKKTPFFSEQERAALFMAEKLTELRDRELNDEDYEKIKPFFSDKELVDLGFAIANMNALNRMAIAFKVMPK